MKGNGKRGEVTRMGEKARTERRKGNEDRGKETMMGRKEGKLERGMKWDNIISPLSIPTFLLCCLPSSVYPTFPHASFVLTSFQPSLPPSLPFSPSVFTRLCLLPLPVAPVYEGEFIGLPGAVSWRWPPQLKPQQGFTLHMEQKQHSGHTGLFPSAHIYTCWYTHTSHYLLMSIPVFFLLSLLNPASLHRAPDDWLGGCCFCFFLLYIAPSSICFLLVYKEQLASGGLHFLTSTCVVLFFTHRCYKSAHSVHSYIIYVVCPPCCAFVLFYA